MAGKKGKTIKYGKSSFKNALGTSGGSGSTTSFGAGQLKKGGRRIIKGKK